MTLPDDDDDKTLLVGSKDGTLGLPPVSVRPGRPVRPIPTKFGRYEVRLTLGSGGMGSVYLVYDTELDRLVALKVPHLGGEQDQDLIARFHAEAQAAAGIEHPNLCRVFDVGSIDGIPFLTMTYVRGRPLTDLLIRPEPMPQEQAAMIVHDVAAAMHVAHAANIIHRDLKPSNIMLNEHGSPVVMDFGVARRSTQARRQLTHLGTALGTPGYMAPEQMRGDANVGPAADIYSLGATLYHLLAGHLPFAGSPVETVRMVLRGDRPKSPEELRPGLDPQLVAICQKAMAPHIADRYADMRHFAADLVELLRGRSRHFQISDDAETPGADLSTPEVLSRAGERLFMLGRWSVAEEVIGAAATLAGSDGNAAVRQRNRLVHLCKNMDRWPEALAHSEWCRARLNEGTPPELAAAVYVNRGSVLYDLGRRPEAGESFQLALGHATKCRTSASVQTRAAATNNLGVFHHYGDNLLGAERAVLDGRAGVEPKSLLCAYLDTNLGLVQLTRGLVDPAQAEAAAHTLAQVTQRFSAAGHLQGISYALSNHGVCQLAAGRYDEARAKFDETIRIAERIGEKWTAYGATANLALLELARPGGDPAHALALARDAARRADENSDPKGVADASLLVARAALDLAARTKSQAPLDGLLPILDATQLRYASLGQRLGEALAIFGRLELLPDPALEARARDILSRTQLAALPSRFIAPPWHMLLLLELF